MEILKLFVILSSIFFAGVFSCDILKLSKCMAPLQASLSQLSSGSSPNADAIRTMCSGYNQFKACKPASCENSPLLQSMAQHTAMLDSTCAEFGGSREGSGGSGGGPSKLTCDVREMSACIQPLQESITQLPIDGSPPAVETLQTICSGYKEFKKCMPAECHSSPVFKSMSQSTAALDSICASVVVSEGSSGRGCDFVGILECTKPVMELNATKLASMTLTSKMVTSSCQIFASYKTCMETKVDDSCKQNSQLNQTMATLEKLSSLIDYMCKEKIDEIMEHKDCFDQPEIADIIDKCSKNNSKIMTWDINVQSNNRPSDTEICNAINVGAACIKEGIGESCSEDSKNFLYNFHRGGMILMTSLPKCEDVSPTTTDASIPGGSTTSPITRSDITCNGDDISVYVPMDLLPMGRSVTWRDPDCAITNNGTHYVGTVDFNHCGTTVRFNDDSVEFRNELISHSSNHHDTPANAVIDFGDGFDSVVPVECVYPRKENAMASYLPVQGQVRFFEKRMGHLDLELQQVEDQTFTVPVTQGSFPPRVHLNNNFYIKVSSNHMNRSDVGIHLDNCVATPSASPADSTFQPLIKNGCPSMPSVTVYQSPVTEARVGIRAFQFSSHPAQTVYIHCEVSVCPVTDSQCTAGCVASSRQRRAAEPGQKRTSHLLSAGPYILMAEEGSVQVATVVAGICGCIAIVATTFAVVMWRKQRELAAKTILE